MSNARCLGEIFDPVSQSSNCLWRHATK